MTKDKAPIAKMSLRDYRGQLHDYNTDFLKCKDLRHLWQVAQDYSPQEDNKNWMHRSLVCARCGTTRTDKFYVDKRNKRVVRGGSTYRYPPGFSMRGLPKERKLGEVMRYESFIRAIASNNGNDNDQEK